MTHRFPIKEIALQSGLSTATVDRVLNGRAHVSAQTRARVTAAIGELEGQEAQLAARGRRMFVDVVVDAPVRFSSEVRAAAEAELASLGPAVLRPRFAFGEEMSEATLSDHLQRILKRGSQGVLLKARDLPSVRQALRRFQARKIPVVTLVTDLPGAARLGYVGLDNAQAGRIAAYLIARSLDDASGAVLMTKSNRNFFGEVERETAFAAELADRAPGLRLIDASGGAGLNRSTRETVAAALRGVRALRAVYSMGGGNAAILDQIAAAGLSAEVFIAHDLDRDNRQLLRAERLSFVLHHDLRRDLRQGFQQIMSFHGLMPDPGTIRLSEIQVLTPMNL